MPLTLIATGALDMPMAKQREAIESALKEFPGDERRRVDVSVIGLKL